MPYKSIVEDIVMNKLIYYPSFEANNLDWLKFALLYIEKLNPIIPERGDRYLSNLFWQLREETDLLEVHRPNYRDGQLATMDAIDTVENVLRNPDRYTAIFRTSNIVHNWQNKQNHLYTLFEDKYTDNWYQFCINNSLATKTDEGLKLSKTLGYVYMTILANAIAESAAISTITDQDDLDRFNILIRRIDDIDEMKLHAAQSIINLKLPANLNQISFEEVIKLRNKAGFKERLRAFHVALNSFLSNLEEGKEVEDFVKSYDKVWNEFSSELVRLGVGIANIGVGAWLVTQSTNSSFLEYLKTVLGSIHIVTGSFISIRGVWKNTKSKRFCRKYLADLSKLAPLQS